MLRSILRIVVLLNLVVLVLSFLLALQGRPVFGSELVAHLWTISFCVSLGAAAVVESVEEAQRRVLAKLDQQASRLIASADETDVGQTAGEIVLRSSAEAEAEALAAIGPASGARPVLDRAVQRVACPKCKTMLTVKPADRNVRCGNCGGVFNTKVAPRDPQ
jgi:LSD1 subclass zinc finger protein